MTVAEQLTQRLAKQVDLPAYLSHRGYQFAGTVRGHDSSVGLTVGLVMTPMSPAPGSSQAPLVLSRDPDRGGWTYFDPAEPSNRGTIVDYLERAEKLSRAQSIVRIAACLDRHCLDVPEALNYRAHIVAKPIPLRIAEADHNAFAMQHRQVLTELARLGVRTQTVLEPSGARTLPEAGADRFSSFKVPADVTRLVEDPPKLWTSNYKPTDQQLVLVERPVDAIAHAQKHKNPHACYVAVGAELTPTREKQLAHLLAELPKGMNVVAAFGRDEPGRRLAAQAQQLTPSVPMARQAPEFGARWSEQMQLQARHSRSVGQQLSVGVAR